MVTSLLVFHHVGVTDHNWGCVGVKELRVAQKIVKSQTFIWLAVSCSLTPIRIVAFGIGVELSESVDKAGVKLSLKGLSLLSCDSCLLGQMLCSVVPHFQVCMSHICRFS